MLNYQDWGFCGEEKAFATELRSSSVVETNCETI